MRNGLLLLPALLWCILTANAQEKGTPLQGSWAVLRMERGGRPAPAELLKAIKVVIKGNTLTMSDAKGGESATFKLDPARKPGQIDLVFKEGPKGDVERAALGIYALDGDTLKLAWRKDGGPRPTEFASTKGERTSEYLILKRTGGR